MGIVVALIYLPIYLIFSLGAVYAAKKVRKITVGGENTKPKYGYDVIGFIASTVLTWVLIWLLPVKGNTDYEALFTQISLTLLTPAVLGVVLSGLIKITSVEKKKTFAGFVSGVYYSTIAIPWLTIVAASNYHNIANFPMYYSLCYNAEIEFLEKVEPANSVFLSSDLFTSTPKGRQAETRPIGLFLLNQSSLEYIEKPSEPGSEYKFDRIHTEGERILRSRSGEKTKYVTNPIELVTAEYIVTPQRIDLPNEKTNGIGGSQIEVRRISDNKLIAFAKYYWDNKTFKSCPSEAHSGLFAYQFIATALNVLNDQGRIKGIE